MICPKCGSYNVGVIETSPCDNAKLFRRRKCKDCGNRFRTVEITDDGSKDFRKEYSAAMASKCTSKGVTA